MRYHHLDAARALLMLLGIPFHAALIYDPFADWSVHSPDQTPLASLLASSITFFRMPAFFIVSGFFSQMTLTKAANGGGWLKSRFVRLLVPLATCALLLNPFQMYAASETRAFYGEIGPSFRDLVTSPGDQWIRHLWFLPVLAIHCVILLPLGRHLASWTAPLAGPIERASDGRMTFAVLAVAGLCALYSVVVAGGFAVADIHPPFLMGLFNPRQVLIYLPFFLCGAILYACPALFERANRPMLALLPIVLAIAAAYAVVWRIDSSLGKIARVALTGAGGLLMAQVLLSLLKRHADFHSPPVRAVVAASFTIYLFHQPLISLLGLAFLRVASAPLIELAIARSATLMFLFNGVPFKRSRP